MSIEQRYAIKFSVMTSKTAKETLDFIQTTYKEKAYSRAQVFRLHKTFRDDPNVEVEDKPRSGRPKSSMADEIKELLDHDRRLTVREIASKVDLGVATVHSIIKEELGMKKVCARWIPRLLTDDQKQQRIDNSEMCLGRYRRQGNRFLEEIITVDETWISVYDPETKQDSSVWKTPNSPSPTKALVRTSAKKMMFIVFFDIRGVVLCHAVPTGKTVTGQYYSKVSINYVFVYNLI